MNRFCAVVLTAICLNFSVVTLAAASAAAPQVLVLQQALEIAGAAAPSVEAADANVRATRAARAVAAQHPNPTISAEIENVGGSQAYNAIEAQTQTVWLGVPVELGGKRSARIAVANAKGDRAQVDWTVALADLRLAVTKAYVAAIAADRRLATANDQLKIANDVVRAAHVRVASGRASPLEEQRAGVTLANAKAAAENAARSADLARADLSRRIGQSARGSLDEPWFDRIDDARPMRPIVPRGTLALAAAQADEAAASASLKQAQSERIPDVTLSAGARRLPVNNDVAAVFGASVPFPLFNHGNAQVRQASAERDRATALRRAAELDVEQAIAQAQADVANAAVSARAAAGPALAAAQEGARIARIGYREGKFGQLDLLDAERTLAETRADAIDALSAYHIAQAELERLTTQFSKD